MIAVRLYRSERREIIFGLPAINTTALRPAGMIVWSALLLVFLLGTFRATLVGLSDWYFRIGTQPEIERAIHYMPSNARYHYYDALAIEQNKPTSPDIARQFEQAVRLNPRFSDAMLAWSVELELAGQRAAAEALLDRAQDIDHLLRPSWALANFYYRTGNEAKFWAEAQNCFRLMSRTGVMEGRFALVPVFNLCWNVTQDPSTILTKAIPNDRVIQGYYLGYLLNTNRFEAAKQVAALLLPNAQPINQPFLFAYCNSMIALGEIASAVQAWNAMSASHLINFAPLNPAANVSLTDSRFSAPPTGVGFDWRVRVPESVRFRFTDGSPGYQFTFNGSQPEAFDLISEIIPVVPGRTYQVTSNAKADFDPSASGIRWSVWDYRSNHQIGAQGDGHLLKFAVPNNVSALELRLSYQRQLGTLMLKGDYDLSQVTLRQSP